MSGTVLLWLLPWVGVIAYLVLVVRDPPELPPLSARGAGGEQASYRPAVSVIVPARDEAHNIERCLRSLVASAYSDFEVIVVDDRSTDGTGAVARAVEPGHAHRILVIDGAELPEGWFGKQWACWQGMKAARGELLLFTDADTVHQSSLLPRSVAALAAERADCVTVIGRQIMDSFWERLVQPQVFMLLAVRYPRMGERPLPQRRWRGAIANGQYMLFERGAYERMGGHEAVRYEAAEDLRLAQRLVREGGALVVRYSYEGLGTRMYRGFGEIVAGWSKNMVPAGLQTVPPWLRPVTPLAMFVSGATAWLLPPVVLVATLLGAGGAARADLHFWAATATALLMLFWSAVSHRFGAPAWMGLLYPLGALVGHWILLRSWLGRRRVQWKGRSYAWDVYSDSRSEASKGVAPGPDSG